MIETGSPAFPTAKDDDDDDVAWALSTAQVQWKRGSAADAVTWLRRAIDSAVSVGATWRAAELTRQTDAIEAHFVHGAAPVPASAPPPTEVVVDDFDGTDIIDDDATSLPPDADMSEATERYLKGDPKTALPADDELVMVGGVMAFSVRPVREVMTPRTDIVAVDEHAALEDIRMVFAQSGYSRIPVYRGTLDEIVGMLHAFDLFKLREGDPLPVRTVVGAGSSRRRNAVVSGAPRSGSSDCCPATRPAVIAQRQSGRDQALNRMSAPKRRSVEYISALPKWRQDATAPVRMVPPRSRPGRAAARGPGRARRRLRQRLAGLGGRTVSRGPGPPRAAAHRIRSRCPAPSDRAPHR